MNSTLCADLERALNDFYALHPRCFHPFLWHEREELPAACAAFEDWEDNTFALFSEILAPHLGFDRSDVPQKRCYDYICQQLYQFFTHKDYQAERLTAAAFREMFIAAAAVAVSRQTGADAALATAAVTLVVTTALKMGVRAWCQAYEDRHPEMTQ